MKYFLFSYWYLIASQVKSWVSINWGSISLRVVIALGNWPEEISAEGTERGLSEEFGHKLMAFNLVNFMVFDSAATPGDTPTQAEVISI